jgi:hypothetical protein
VKERGQKPKSNFHSNGNREPAEVLCQQGEEALNRKANRSQLPRPSTQYFLKEPPTETSLGEATTMRGNSSALPLKSQDKHSYETPLAIIRPQALGPIPDRGNVHLCD